MSNKAREGLVAILAWVLYDVGLWVAGFDPRIQIAGGLGWLVDLGCYSLVYFVVRAALRGRLAGRASPPRI